ncbi:hypothetical protein [Kurthia sibirica]|uniref:hypothetical protein n=1 Tax=Kurthia sibirica TaxID=202750 RepID=UPI001173BFF8|nr:hypothetical protein [Kurthia sibirica]GEK35446.1 hypothetical protein KSI01_29790 [Kurthia sibirica]
MTLSTNAVKVLEYMIKQPSNSVYSVEGCDIYQALKIDKTSLTNAIHGLLQHGYNVTTFSTKRDISRIQINMRDPKVKKYINEMEKIK